MNICVFASSSDAVDEKYFTIAGELGAAIGQKNHTLVYGGARVGLMGAVAKAVHERHGKVVGVIPEIILRRELAYTDADELITTKDLRERKEIMELRSDAFIALPGGFGTLEEVLEIITLKQLQLHSKPIVFLNVNNFYDELFVFFEKIYNERFAKFESKQLYCNTPNISDAFAYLERYQPTKLAAKWF